MARQGGDRGQRGRPLLGGRARAPGLPPALPERLHLPLPAAGLEAAPPRGRRLTAALWTGMKRSSFDRVALTGTETLRTHTAGYPVGYGRCRALRCRAAVCSVVVSALCRDFGIPRARIATAMVRKGWTVRVRQRAFGSSLLLRGIADFPDAA